MILSKKRHYHIQNLPTLPDFYKKCLLNVEIEKLSTGERLGMMPIQLANLLVTVIKSKIWFYKISKIFLKKGQERQNM